MNRLFCVSFLCVFCAFSLCPLCFTENTKLSVGEKLIYNVYWKFVKVGYGTLEVRDIVDFNGRKAYNIYSEAKSAPFFDVFFKVRDFNSSLIDVERFHSLVFEQHIAEGGYKREKKTVYDQNKHLATNHNNETFEIPENAMDILAAFYWVRTQKLKSGESLTTNVTSGKKNYQMEVQVRKKEKIKIDNKKYKTILVEPILQDVGIFKSSGKIKIWFTNDEYHIPVKMTSEIAVGSIVAEIRTDGQ